MQIIKKPKIGFRKGVNSALKQVRSASRKHTNVAADLSRAKKRLDNLTHVQVKSPKVSTAISRKSRLVSRLRAEKEVSAVRVKTAKDILAYEKQKRQSGLTGATRLGLAISKLFFTPRVSSVTTGLRRIASVSKNSSPQKRSVQRASAPLKINAAGSKLSSRMVFPKGSPSAGPLRGRAPRRE